MWMSCYPLLRDNIDNKGELMKDFLQLYNLVHLFLQLWYVKMHCVLMMAVTRTEKTFQD